MKINICPVCGYDKLDASPRDEFGCPSYEICPCCGFEFGFDDDSEGLTYDQYRERWLKQGAKWVSKSRPKPKNFDLCKQLRNIGIILP